MGTIDTIAVAIITILGLFILYRGLKEPLDQLFSLIGRGLGSIKDKLMDGKDTGGEYYDDIRYG